MRLYVHVCTYITLHYIHYIKLHYITLRTLHCSALLTYILELCSCYTSSLFPSWKPPTWHVTCTAFKSHSRRVGHICLAEPWVCGLAHVRGNSLTKMQKTSQMGKYKIQNGFLDIDLDLCMIESSKSHWLLISETYGQKHLIYICRYLGNTDIVGQHGTWGVVCRVCRQWRHLGGLIWIEVFGFFGGIWYIMIACIAWCVGRYAWQSQ